MPKLVADPGRLSIEPDVPGEPCIAHRGERLDSHVDPEQVRDPARHGFRQRRWSPRSAAEVERKIELIAALPVTAGILLAQDVDLLAYAGIEHGDQRQHRGGARPADRLLVAQKEAMF